MEQTIAKQTPGVIAPTHKERRSYNRRTVFERSVESGWWGLGEVGRGGVLNQFYSRETSLLVLTQLLITNICSLSIGTFALSVKQSFVNNDSCVFFLNICTPQFVTIQSTLVISNSKGLSETLRDISTSKYQSCRSEENNQSNNHI